MMSMAQPLTTAASSVDSVAAELAGLARAGARPAAMSLSARPEDGAAAMEEGSFVNRFDNGESAGWTPSWRRMLRSKPKPSAQNEQLPVCCTGRARALPHAACRRAAACQAAPAPLCADQCSLPRTALRLARRRSQSSQRECRCCP